MMEGSNRPFIGERKEEPPPMKTIFLFGAGSSIPAGIPSIDGLTKGFVAEVALRKSKKITLRPRTPLKLFTLLDICKDQFNRKDIESLISLIVKLENEKFKQTLTHQFSDLKNIGRDTLREFKMSIQEYIRRKCEKIKNVDYLWGLEGFLSDDEPLNIFTLNYDGVLEIYCQKNNISYTDGFNPFWNEKEFENNHKIHLYKIHGSLYWFKAGDGIFIKVPIKGLQISGMRYLTDESVSEMMIYPELEKNKQQTVYSLLTQKFREELGKSDFCVVIGYSFRDTDVREIIKEALSSNPNLWLIIVSPSANKIKKDFFSKNPSLATKVCVMNIGIEEALGERKLYHYLETLEKARRLEKSAWLMQSKSEDRLDIDWRLPILSYVRVGHHDRVKHIIEQLKQSSFVEIRGSFPETLEAILCSYSMGYMLEYYKKKKRSKVMMWEKFFLESCKQVEYVFFQQHQDLREHNPIDPNEIPLGVRSFSTSGDHIIEELGKNAKQVIQQIDNTTIRSNIEKLIQTCDLLTLKKNISPTGNSYTPVTPQEIIEGYQKDKLGIYKWTKKIVDSLT